MKIFLAHVMLGGKVCQRITIKKMVRLIFLQNENLSFAIDKRLFKLNLLNG